MAHRRLRQQTNVLVGLAGAGLLAFACGDDGGTTGKGDAGAHQGGEPGHAGSDSGGNANVAGGNTAGSKVSAAGAPGAGGAPAGEAGLGGAAGTPGNSGGEAGEAGAAPLASCGDVERCEPAFLGLDDDCNGSVDEGCSCAPGLAHACFKGDSQYRGTAGCVEGTELCTEEGFWGPCEGGRHATLPDDCYEPMPGACQPLFALPFATVDLAQGIGDFGSGADVGSEFWEVSCPFGVTPCPAVQGADKHDFMPLQSGEYSVTYTRTVNQVSADCTYPLVVKAPGLRVELTWPASANNGGGDLDLYLHRPNHTTAWSGAAICNYENCLAGAFEVNPGLLDWFGAPPDAPPAPVNWYLYPNKTDNSCYGSPRGGQTWQDIGMGCHNPRLDLDRISCNPNVVDPASSSFCGPENANIDFPPVGQWTRIGVDYFSSGNVTGPIYPNVRIFCGGALTAELGTSGYYDPTVPVAFNANQAGTLFWLVADVRFSATLPGCEVIPLYAGPQGRVPLLTTDVVVAATVGPPYPP